MTSPRYRQQFDFARTPYDARNALGIDMSGYMRWVKYTGPPQSFNQGEVTRDGDWTMVANKSTSDRPAPQPSGPELDLLPAWTPATQSASGSYTVYNQWTLNTAGWIDRYGVDVQSQNVGKQHVITLTINGTVKDTFTATPTTAQLYWHDITPIVTLSGAILRVTKQITATGNNYWQQQIGLFATAPTYCSLAQGAKDAAALGTTAYGCHLLFIPGTASPDWDVVAYGGSASGGGGTFNTIVTTPMTVAQLPPVTGNAGMRAFVTDSTATGFLSVVTGGGASAIPVICDGTNWLVG